MKYLLIGLLALIGGCGFSLSIGTSSQQIRSKFVCDDASMKYLELWMQFKKQAELATTDNERQMLMRVANGFIDDYHELSKKETCWVKP